MTPTRQAIKKLLSIVLPTKRFLLRGRLNTNPSRTEEQPVQISLTFDDGPDPRWTPSVLDALDAANWKGTFFLIGRRAEAHPDLVREIIDRGHEVGNHSYAHGEPDETGVQEFTTGVIRTQKLLAEMADREVSLMRPPKGRLDIQKTLALWRSGQSVVLWNVDPCDYRMPSLKSAQRWARKYQPSPGDIVLLHDRLPYAGEIVRTLATIHGKSLQSVTVSHWLATAPAGAADLAKQFLGNLVTS